jgi:formate C-acetyltransferase
LYRLRVTLERAILFTESFIQPLVLRWAKALKHVAESITLAIFYDELVVGRPNTWLGRYTLVYPELDGSIMKLGADTFMAAEGAGKADAVHVTADDKKIIDDLLFSYWNGKDFTPNFVHTLPEDSRLISFGPDSTNIRVIQTFVVLSSSTMRHSQNWVIDWGKLIARGCKGIWEEAKARLAALDRPRDIVHKRPLCLSVRKPAHDRRYGGAACGRRFSRAFGRGSWAGPRRAYWHASPATSQSPRKGARMTCSRCHDESE